MSGGSIKDGVLDILIEAGVPMQRDEIVEAADWLDDVDRVSRALWALKTEGKVVRGVDGWHAVGRESPTQPPGDAGEAPDAGPAPARAPTRKPPAPKRPAPRRGTASRRQVGGEHYVSLAIQPWDFIAANGLGFFEGNIVKYVARWRSKGGVEDLEKARHYLDRLIEHAAGEEAAR